MSTRSFQSSNFDQYKLLCSIIGSQYCVYIEGVSGVGKSTLMEKLARLNKVHMALKNDYADNFNEDEADLWLPFLMNYPLFEAINLHAQGREEVIIVDRGAISNYLYKVIFKVLNAETPRWREMIEEECYNVYLKISSTLCKTETNTLVFVLSEGVLPIIWSRMRARGTDLDNDYLHKYEFGPCNEDYFYLRIQNEVFLKFYTRLATNGLCCGHEMNIKIFTINYEHLYCSDYLHTIQMYLNMHNF